MLSSVKLDKEYHKLVEIIVCSRDNKQCVIHRCENCPGDINLLNYLSSCLNPNDSDEEDHDDKQKIIKFSHWVTTDRCELQHRQLPVTDSIDLLVEKMSKLTAHSYIARSHAQYLTQLKLNLDNNKGVLVNLAKQERYMLGSRC